MPTGREVGRNLCNQEDRAMSDEARKVMRQVFERLWNEPGNQHSLARRDYAGAVAKLSAGLTGRLVRIAMEESEDVMKSNLDLADQRRFVAVFLGSLAMAFEDLTLHLGGPKVLREMRRKERRAAGSKRLRCPVCCGKGSVANG